MQFLSLQDRVDDLLRGVFAFLSQFIYSIIAWLYDLFMTISQVQILSEDSMQGIYQRVTIILTIVMIFYVTFEVVKYVIEPNSFSDKEKGAGKLIYKMVAVVVLIAFVPTIFSLSYKLQNAILQNQILAQVIMGQQNVKTGEIGKSFSANTLGMFYYPETGYISGTSDRIFSDDELTGANCDGVSCIGIVNLNMSSLKQQGTIPLLSMGLDARTLKGTTQAYYIHFDGLLAVAVGIFVAYMLILYCIDAGVRVAQLTFLQVIAPIPIIGYLSPKKDGIFEKWVKQCFTTYIDLFLRMAIIYFVLLICQALTSNYNEGLKNLTGNSFNNTLVYIALIMGLLLFAKKAPNMLQELFPKMGAASGNFGLKGGERGFKGLGRVAGGIAGGAAGAIAGAVTGGLQGWRRSKALGKNGEVKGTAAGIWGAAKGIARGAVGGTTRGIYNGSKKGNIIKNSIAGIKNQTQANQRFGNREENGYTLGHQIEDRARSVFGFSSRVQNLEQAKAPMTQENETIKKINDTRKQIEDRALSKLTEKGGKGSAAAQMYDRETQRLKDLQENQTVRSQEFRVGKYTDARTARNAYENDVALAKASVNKSNFIDHNTGNFDEIGYKKACEAAAAKVKADDYTVAYRTQADADAAVKAAGLAEGIDRQMFSTDNEYNQALLAAGINKDMYIKGYSTQDEADMALAEEINTQKAKVDAAKDAAVADYVANSGDGAIDSMLDTLNTTVTEYNETASVDRTITYNNGRGEAIDSNRIKSDFLAFSDMVKGSGSAASDPNNFNARQNRNEQILIKQNAEIARIKNETEGSGINEGKK